MEESNKPFAGFPEGKVRFTSIPDLFFSQLLPDIDHLGELKVTLYTFWRLDHMEGTFRYLRRENFLEDSDFMAGLAEDSGEAEADLDEALERCVQRGTFLKASLELDESSQDFYFLNTPKGRAAVKAIKQGEWRHSGDPASPLELIAEQPNIYNLYEENIGPLTPMIAETLKDAEDTYPDQWIEEAVRIAVENNARSWSYVEAILKRWQEGGRDERKDRRDTEKDRRSYVEGELSDFIEH
jgi:DnaD/phage-associated family protein